MSDTATIGTFAALALGSAADAALKGAVGETVKDAYAGLKQRVAMWAGGDLDALERTPASLARRAVVAEAVDCQSAANKELIKELAETLLNALSKENSNIGIKVSSFEAMRIHLGKIIVNDGVGIQGGNFVADSDITIDSLEVGEKLGKMKR